MSFVLNVRELFEVADHVVDDASVTPGGLHLGQVKVLQGFRRIGVVVSRAARAAFTRRPREIDRFRSDSRVPAADPTNPGSPGGEPQPYVPTSTSLTPRTVTARFVTVHTVHCHGRPP
ncbi:hypothetical protein [Embleya sp. MST-111070]|uniref:hypothetical protein n=1 Tax=Embleya sp. MST-111070 TaxID=3398231 RepID=UPI003F73B0E4